MAASPLPTGSRKILKLAYLQAVSPRQAFYQLWLEEDTGRFRVGKMSGAGGRIWHRQIWEWDNLAAAEAFFHRRLRRKTNPGRRSRRRYRLLPQLPVPPAPARQLWLDF